MDSRKGDVSLQPFQYFSRSLKMLVLAILVLSILFFFNQFKLANYFPIKSVRVYGAVHEDRTEIKELLLPLVDRGFFAINVEYIRERLMQLPWVSDIFVRRTWPDKIEITVIEKAAVARWNNDKLLSQSGEVFTPKLKTYPANLPFFTGPDSKQIIMLNYFNEINRLLSPVHAKISHLELSPYYNWKVTLTNGITLQIGHKDVLTRLNHFVKVYPKIIGDHASDVDYIDLRYANGMAVRWKTSYSA